MCPCLSTSEKKLRGLDVEIKTIWQPVPPWPENAELLESKYGIKERLPKVKESLKHEMPRLYKALGYRNTNAMRKWIVRDGPV